MASITVKRGDSLKATFHFLEDGVAANLSGCSARMQIREFSRDGSGAVLVDVSSDDYLSVGGEDGVVTADIPGSLISFTTPRGRNAQADVELVYPDGSVKSSATFGVKVEHDITRSD